MNLFAWDFSSNKMFLFCLVDFCYFFHKISRPSLHLTDPKSRQIGPISDSNDAYIDLF